jgi:NTP pyrophosphatase (non-canonical NTP hydrolase)
MNAIESHKRAMGMANETQDSIGRWNVDTFGPADPLGTQHARRVLMEVVELCLAVGMNRLEMVETVCEVSRKAGKGLETVLMPEPGKVPGEAADVLITLWGFAHRRGIDLGEETDKKMKTNRERVWKLNGDGTAQHVAGPGPAGESES